MTSLVFVLALAAADCCTPATWGSTSTAPNAVEETCGVHGLCAGKRARDCREPGEVGPWQRPFESCQGALSCPARLAFSAFVFSILWIKPKGSCDADWGGIGWWIAFGFPTKACPAPEPAAPPAPPAPPQQRDDDEERDAAVAW